MVRSSLPSAWPQCRQAPRTGLALVWSCCVCVAQEAITPLPAVELNYAVPGGVVFRVRQSSSLEQWIELGGHRCGTGETVSQLVAVEAPQRFFCLELDLPALAPPSVAGGVFELNGGSSQREIHFVSDTSGWVRLAGAATAETFSCVARRITPESVRVSLTFPDSREQLLTLTFVNGELGTFSLEQVQPLKVSLSRGSFATATLTTAAAPSSIAHQQFIFADGGQPEILRCDSAVAGKLMQTEETHAVALAYTVNGATASSCTLTFSAGNTDSYTLSFKTESSGTFVRQQLRGTSGLDTDRGVFSLVPLPPGN